ncbi:DUF6355 family natural product biosynthesis protein [Lentzea sp. NPDC042327]|uniref:DUF6355 family natural product biosynthesis protein n=1 Tax=Lentzea sp. NPDC042327 TaxID=3154801 RepID=UPI0033E31AF3
MKISAFGRIVGAFIVTVGLMFGLLVGTSSAQLVDSAARAPATQPSSGIEKPAVNGSDASTAQLGTFSACGWQSPIYRHCGQNQFILVRIDFSWSFDTTDIWVTKGETDLVWRFGRNIDYAWCIQNCG